MSLSANFAPNRAWRVARKTEEENYYMLCRGPGDAAKQGAKGHQAVHLPIHIGLGKKKKKENSDISRALVYIILNLTGRQRLLVRIRQ